MEKGEAQSTIDSELMLFQPVNVNRSTERVSYIDYRPNNQLSHATPVEIAITNNSSQYTDFRRSKLYARCRITTREGKKLTDDDIVAPANLLLHNLWDKVDIFLQQKQITTGSAAHSYRALLDILLNSGGPSLESAYQAQLYFKDTSGGAINNPNPLTAPINVGLYERYKLTKNSKIVDVIGNLCTDLNSLDKYLLNGIHITIKLTQSTDAFRLMSPKGDAQYIVELLDVYFRCCQVTVTPEVITAHNNLLAKNFALYPYTKTMLKAYAIPAGSFSYNASDLFLGAVPSRLVCCFVSAKAFSGSYAENPYNLKHYNLNTLSLTIDGQSVPGRPFTCKFQEDKGQNYVEAFLALFSGLTREEADSGIYINR